MKIHKPKLIERFIETLSACQTKNYVCIYLYFYENKYNILNKTVPPEIPEQNSNNDREFSLWSEKRSKISNHYPLHSSSVNVFSNFNINSTKMFCKVSSSRKML